MGWVNSGSVAASRSAENIPPPLQGGPAAPRHGPSEGHNERWQVLGGHGARSGRQHLGQCQRRHSGSRAAAGGCRAPAPVEHPLECQPGCEKPSKKCPLEMVLCCGKYVLAISLPHRFVLKVYLHTNWHLLPWLIIHPDPILHACSPSQPWAPDVTADDRASARRCTGTEPRSRTAELPLKQHITGAG